MKVRTGYTLSQKAKTMLEELAIDIGISQSAVLELAIRMFKRIWESPIDKVVQIQDLPEQKTD